WSWWTCARRTSARGRRRRSPCGHSTMAAWHGSRRCPRTRRSRSSATTATAARRRPSTSASAASPRSTTSSAAPTHGPPSTRPCHGTDRPAGAAWAAKTRLAREPAFPEERLFLGGALPPEYRIPVREAPEPPDDVPVVQRPRRIAAARLDQRHGTVLVRGVLVVLDRQVAEDPQFRRDLAIVARGQHPFGEMPGQGIGRVRVPGPAEDIARELVQQEQQGQRPV